MSSVPFFSRCVFFALRFLLTQAKNGPLGATNRVFRKSIITVKMIVKLIISFFRTNIRIERYVRDRTPALNPISQIKKRYFVITTIIIIVIIIYNFTEHSTFYTECATARFVLFYRVFRKIAAGEKRHTLYILIICIFLDCSSD